MKSNHISYRKVLFVCLANASRSVIAECLFNSHIERTCLKRKGIIARSAGIDKQWSGKPIAKETQLVLSELGVYTDGRFCQHINQELVDWAELILTMETKHNEYLEKHFPLQMGKVFLLGQFLGEGYDIPDPYQLGIEAYRTCVDYLLRMVRLLFEQIRP